MSGTIQTSSARVLMGVDRVLAAPERLGGLLAMGASPSRIGLVTSDGAPPGLPGLGSTRRALLDAGIPLKTLFTPEHGLTSLAEDGAPVPHGRDPETGLPVVSLYGPALAPAQNELADLEMVLFDLQDVGVRFYTFLWTLLHLMEACEKAGVPIRIMDRPNPLGGEPEPVEGPLLDMESAASFLGRWSIPIRHALTLGEMALLLKEEMGLEVDLGVVKMEGWERSMMWPDTGLPYAPPSPGLPDFSSVLLYPGLALLEATNVHEGRGTPLAFRWFGAPWMDAGAAATALNDTGIPGVRAFPHPLRLPVGGRIAPVGGRIAPVGGRTAPGWEGADPALPCPGVRLEVVDPRALRPVALGLRLLSLLPTFGSGGFRWVPYPTAVNPSGEGHLKRLLGSEALASQIQGDPGALDRESTGKHTLAEGWWGRATPHLLYR